MNVLIYISLAIISISEGLIINRLFFDLYEDFSIIISLCFVFIFTISSIISRGFTKVILSLSFFFLLFISYYNNINSVIEKKHKEKEEFIRIIDLKIDKLRKDLTNKRECQATDEKLYMNCLYLASLETKNYKFILDEINKLEEEKKSFKKIEINYTFAFVKIFSYIFLSIFMTSSVFILTNKINTTPNEKINKSILSLKKKGYSAEEIADILNLSRATVYRRLSNAKQ